MNYAKLFGRIVTIALLLAVAGCKNPGNGKCEHLITIARDKMKIDYLENWINNHIEDDDFLQSMGWLGTKSMLDSPEEMVKLQLDWGYLGISPNYASLQLNRDDKDRDNFLDSSNIKSISFGEGRNSIFIKVNNSTELGLGFRENVKTNLTTISSTVSVYCEGKERRHP